MNRRELLKSAALGGGALNVPAQSPHAHAVAAATPPAAWKPLLLDAHQNATVTAIAELIIPKTDTPGAREAKVNEYIDLILNDGPREARTRFIDGLNQFDGAAIRRHQLPFVRCTAAQQTALLEAALATPFFRQVKMLTVQGYYTSRIGIDELNKGGRVPGGFGCKHEGGH